MTTGRCDPSTGPVMQAVANALAGARRLCFVTGAGVSADSGLPTYRGVGGLYEDAAAREGLPIEVLLSGEMLAREPARTWKHIAAIERACRGARPNAAHRAIAALERRFEVCVITQNVDGLHRAAGSTDVIELHGDIHDLACTRCAWRVRVEDYAELTIPPACPACDAPARPGVVLFGEWLPEAMLARHQQALSRGFDAVFAVGTTAVFPYVQAPVLEAQARGVPTVEINPDRTVLSSLVTYRVSAGAAAALAALAAALEVRID